MSRVVVTGGTLKCSHGGVITVATGDPRLTVQGAGALLLGMEDKLSFASGSPPCANQTKTVPPAPAPCVTQAAAAGQATKLSVGGKPVLLDTANGTTVPAALPADPGAWKVAEPGQTKLEAI